MKSTPNEKPRISSHIQEIVLLKNENLNLVSIKRAHKVNFESDNLTAVVEAVVKAKPAGVKGQYVKSATLATTMGPGIKLDLKPTLALSSS